MAQTKRKRRSKHRGTAAGTIEARGRTGRKPTATERRTSMAQDARARRVARLDRPPTWRGALTRAVVATVVFLVLVIVVLRQPPEAALPLAAFTLAFYTPMGYYVDLLIYRRRQRRKAAKARADTREQGGSR